MTGPFVQRFFDADNNSIYDSSCFLGGTLGSVGCPTYPIAWFVPFINPHKHIFQTIGANIQTVVPLSNVSFAIYKDTFNAGFPYLLQLYKPFGITPSDVLGNTQINIDPYELPQGYYWLAITCSHVGVRVASAQPVSGPTILGFLRSSITTRRLFLGGGLNEPFGSWDDVAPVSAVNGATSVPRVFFSLNDIG